MHSIISTERTKKEHLEFDRIHCPESFDSFVNWERGFLLPLQNREKLPWSDDGNEKCISSSSNLWERRRKKGLPTSQRWGTVPSWTVWQSSAQRCGAQRWHACRPKQQCNQLKRCHWSATEEYRDWVPPQKDSILREPGFKKKKKKTEGRAAAPC